MLNFKQQSEITTDTLSKVGSLTPLTNFNVGSRIRTLVEVFSEVVAELYAYGSDMLKASFLDTATGVWLERHASEFGLTRNPAVKTVGDVIFSRSTADDTNITIPVDTIVATKRDSAGAQLRYLTTEEVILAAGTTEITAPAEAEEAGSLYNVSESIIVRMLTHITGVDNVSNASDWITTTGAEVETDTELRQRCFLVWDELSQGGTAAAYRSWARSVEGVASAFVDDTLPRGDGTVDVYIMGQSGPPEPALIADVQVVIDANKPICSDALVLAPTTVTVDITASVTPWPGHDADTIQTGIEHRISVFFAEVDDADLDIPILGVGNDVVRAQLIAIIMGVSGVYDVDLSAPADDVVVSTNEFPKKGIVSITMEAPTDE